MSVNLESVNWHTVDHGNFLELSASDVIKAGHQPHHIDSCKGIYINTDLSQAEAKIAFDQWQWHRKVAQSRARTKHGDTEKDADVSDSNKPVTVQSDQISCLSLSADAAELVSVVEGTKSAATEWLLRCFFFNASSVVNKKPSCRWRTARASCQLKSDKILHKCSTDCLQPGNDLQGHSRSLTLVSFDRPHMIYFLLVFHRKYISIL